MGNKQYPNIKYLNIEYRAMKRFFYTLLICSVFCSVKSLYSQSQPAPKHADLALEKEEEDLAVFNHWIKWNNPGSMLINHLNRLANGYYAARDAEIARIKTREDWIRRQKSIKDTLMKIVGPFPEKTSLNPKITGVIKRKGYRVEKIVYESMPGFYVTGCLYIPEEIKGKAPAILNVIGHNQDAFRMELYQLINYNLVRKGMIVLAIDPLGQGEHVQYFDSKINFSSIGYSVIEHCYFGNQLFLSGCSPARYFVWDGIRGIDYLVSRNDVDPGRIGVTGWSGGGTVTSFISAFDERVKVSVPCSWAVTNKRLLETKGIQDTENSFIHGLAKGITFEDLLEVRAPKPTLMAFNSRDEYLTIQGAYEAYAEAKKAYKTFGTEDNLEMVEDDSKHWMTPKIRSAIYGFFIKHFNMPGDRSEQEVDLLSAAELSVTPTGQISTSLGGDMIFDVNKKDAAKLIARLAKSRNDIDKHLREVVIKAKEISGFMAPASAAVNPLMNGTYQRKGYSVGKYAIAGEEEYAIPILLFVPNDTTRKHRALVYIHSNGKVTDARPGGEIEKLVKMGYVVAAADILGIGETKNTVTNKEGTADAGNTAVLIGRSVVGIQAGDIIRVVDYLMRRSDVDSTKIGVIGINEMCIPVMHAAAFDRTIRNVILIGSPISYRSIIMNRFYKVGLTPTGNTGPGLPYFIDFSSTIAGVLTAYDLPDLIGCIAPRKVVLAGLKDQMLEPASEALINEELEFPRAAYRSKKASANIKVVSSIENLASVVDWCFIP